jgi:hypothetical protein
LGLDRSEQVVELLEDGRISHAFDIRSRAATKREIRVFAPSLSEYSDGKTGLIDKEDSEILSAIFSDCGDGPTVTASTVSKIFVSSPDHILNLARSGDLTVIHGSPWRTGPHGSPSLQLDSVMRFLARRRL